jgi:hypothetical protein
MLLNANEFAARTTFLSGSDEQKLESGNALKVRANVNFKGHWDPNQEQEFLGIAVMRESDISKLKDLVQVRDGEPMIETDDLRDSEIPSLTVTNNHDREIINVSREQYEAIAPGDEVEVEVRLNSDESGAEYLNGRNVQRVEPENAQTAQVDELANEPEEVPEA